MSQSLVPQPDSRHPAPPAPAAVPPSSSSDGAVPAHTGHDRATRERECAAGVLSSEGVSDADLYRVVLDHLADGVYLVDRDRRILTWNHGAEQISGHEATAVVGRSCFDDLLAHVDDAGDRLCHTICPLLATIGDGAPREAEVWLRHKDGHRVPVRVRTAPIVDAQGVVVGGVEAFDDATPSRAARVATRTATQEALTDALTGLPNRRHVDGLLAGRLAERRRDARGVVLLLIDVDRFKDFNDRLGHAVGDAVLKGIASTILGAVRAGDDAGRWGGDEFVVLADGEDAADALGLAERVRAMVESSEVRVGPERLEVRVSIGVAIAVPGDSPSTLFERADAALYAAKAEGRDRVAMAAHASGAVTGRAPAT